MGSGDRSLRPVRVAATWGREREGDGLTAGAAREAEIHSDLRSTHLGGSLVFPPVAASFRRCAWGARKVEDTATGSLRRLATGGDGRAKGKRVEEGEGRSSMALLPAW